MESAIWWIRRDLRLNDNPALSRAVSLAKSVVPVYVLDPILIQSSKASPRRLDFLYRGLKALDEDLRSRGSRLVIRQGDPLEILSRLVRECEVEQIFAEEDFSPYARQRDHRIAEALPLKLVGGSCASHPESLVKDDGTPYKVFTPYMRSWKARYENHGDLLLSAPDFIPTDPEWRSESFPDPVPGESADLFPPGEGAAMERLKSFADPSTGKIFGYADERNIMAVDGTAQVSPYLRFGMLSARQCIHAAQEAMRLSPDPASRNSAEVWLNELIWREFYLAILYHFPFVLRRSFRDDLTDIPWRNDSAEFHTWCVGQTGYPVVDAAMRQLNETGWMHNRGRMIVASFLVKDLLVDWRWGEKFFMQKLLDGDPAANNGGWQWTAGTGTDAAPYFRVFNPILQGKKFDPQGKFVKRWLPELSSVPEKFIHTPWEMPEEVQKRASCTIGSDYPQPIVDHSFARKRVLDIFNKTKDAYGK